MKLHSNTVILLISSLLLSTINVHGQHYVNIKVNDYTGTYAFGEQCDTCKQSKFVSNDNTFEIKRKGLYFINTGATIGACQYSNDNSYIFFNVGDDFKIIESTVCPQSAASYINENTITFITTPITLTRGQYLGDIFGSFKLQPNSIIERLGAEQIIKLRLVKGLKYYLYCGGSTIFGPNCPEDNRQPMQSGFYFRISPTGEIIPDDTRAITLSKSKKDMRLNTSKLTIYHCQFNSTGSKYQLSGFPAKIITTEASYFVVNSLVNFLKWYDNGMEKFYFFQNF